MDAEVIRELRSTLGLAVAEARDAVRAAGIKNVTLRQADIFDLPFPSESFDHVFVCFVLEHLAEPVDRGEGYMWRLPGRTRGVDFLGQSY